MENYTYLDWVTFWLNGIVLFTVFFVLRLLISKGTIKIPLLLLNCIAIAIVFYFINEPIAEYSDKDSYKLGFENALNVLETTSSIDIGFQFLTTVIRYISDSYLFYFLIIGSVYIFGYLKFIKHFFSKDYQFIVFFTTISALGFYAYGVNTMRQGLALSLFLFTIVYGNSRYKALLFSVIAVSIHKSLLIPVVAFWLIKRYNLKNNFIYFWMVCLVATILFGSSLGYFLGDFLGGNDSRLDGYIYGENEVYQAGFKLNFLIYSIIPILYGLKMKTKINDTFYNEMLSLYILVNAVWLLVIRIAFTDRFAYLSWFLIPFIFLYPLSKKRIFKNQNSIIALILFYLSMISYLIATK